MDTVDRPEWKLKNLKMIDSLKNSSVLLVIGLFVSSPVCMLDSVRFASKKSGGSSKNLGGKSPGRRYGFKKQDGNVYTRCLLTISSMADADQGS